MKRKASFYLMMNKRLFSGGEAFLRSFLKRKKEKGEEKKKKKMIIMINK